jgi:hypothetical protein
MAMPLGQVKFGPVERVLDLDALPPDANPLANVPIPEYGEAVRRFVAEARSNPEVAEQLDASQRDLDERIGRMWSGLEGNLRGRIVRQARARLAPVAVKVRSRPRSARPRAVARRRAGARNRSPGSSDDGPEPDPEPDLGYGVLAGRAA